MLALLAWMWWPSDPPATSADAANTASAAVVARAAATPASDQPPAPVAPPKTRHATPPPKPKAPEPPPLVRARRDLLLAAVRARSPSLRPCVPADATEVRIPVRLHVLRNGPVKGVELAGAAVAREISDCVRRVATSWNFADVELPSDVELFATLALTAGT